ncbi:MAG: sulfatase-like hydrolase/transferase [Rhodospirillaceae bacterium]|jgi:arylsulfatase A-like enzyme|nr:sulfatase-like hydrolase/transferase [Rhodospirillaceae bacterium]MBT5047354.1 sulfatase-like hydrolase/transferase [Rhodospirillaceae bacterium]
MTNRPNFLFIITDQHRADYLGCSGHPVLRTPHLDSVAARGRRFDRFYVANPVCQPNRATLMTGRMPSLHGVRHNGISLSLRSNTFVDLLRANGYRTALLGKSHLQNFETREPIMQRDDPPAGQTWPTGEFAEALKPAPEEERYDQEQPPSWSTDPNYRVNLPFYGYDHVDLCTKHGDEVGGNYDHWLRERVENADGLRGPDNSLPHDYICPQAWRTAIPEEFYPTNYVGDMTVDFLDRYAADDGDAPFYAAMSFPDPHHPFTPPGKYWDMYSPDDMTLPDSFHPGNRTPPPHVAWAQTARDDGTAVIHSQNAFAVREREALEAMALTCGMITMVDDAIGRALGKLEELGLADNTVVIFTADHGDFLGDHGLMLKGPAHYEGVTNVPFIWADTKDAAKPGVCSALAGTIDIGATVLDRAGIAPYNGYQGQSLLPLVEGTADRIHDSVLIEDDQQRSYFGYDSPPRIRTLITERWRMTMSHGVSWGELYDLENDPDEMDNLWDDASHASVRAELTERLARRQMELVDRSPLPTAVA